MEEAQERVNTRIGPLADGLRPAEEAALFCAGTDVPGPALVGNLRSDMEWFSETQLDDEVAIAGAFFGLLVRTFWLGFEFGRAEE